jgi:phosphoglycolate phosphatase
VSEIRRNVMYNYKTIIFDLDGTLFKTDTVFISAIQQVCESRGIKPIDQKDILNLIGEPSIIICRKIFGENLNNEEIEIIRKELRETVDKLFTTAAQLYDGVKNMLDNLRKEGYILCVCTNGSREYIDKVLNTLEINEYFKIIKSRIEGLKNHQLIKQLLDETACCSAIVVGDTVIDFEAAEKVKCLSIGVSYGYGGNCYKNADFIANKPADVFSIIKKVNGLFKYIAAQIVDKKRSSKPFVIGINGVDTSGKTTFTKEFNRYLSKSGFKTQIISIDQFHNPSQVRNKGNDPITSYLNNAFDIAKIEDQIMRPIVLEGLLDKELILLDLEEDKYLSKKRYSVDKNTIVLFEGVLLYREPLNQYFDFRIFIDISFEEVLKRAKKRDADLFGNEVVEKYISKYIPVQKFYIDKYNPKNISDVIIDNEDYWNPKIIKSPSHNKEKKDRINLEKIEEKHLKAICKMLADDEIGEMLGVVEFPQIKDYEGKNNFSYAILGENQEFIGIVELFNISWKNRRAELSIAIEAPLRGKGYGYEAINKILELGFKEHGMNRIWLRVIETNNKAIDLYKKAGFLQEGICRTESLRNAQFVNQIQMSILVMEWINQQG